MAKGSTLVNLKRDWFAPDGSLYQVRDNPHEFPGDWELPKSAEPIGEGGGKTAVVLQQTASGYVKTVTGIPDDVKSVGGALDDAGIEQATQSSAEADKSAKALGLGDVGGRPRESGPLPAGTKTAK